MQDAGSKRETEFIQVGFELFDRSNSAKSDAEVFSIFNNILPNSLQTSTGDVGLLQSAVAGLNTTSLRKAALMRHLWRPVRFQSLMNLFSKTKDENIFLSQYSSNEIKKNINKSGKFIGLRTEAEINSRILALQEDSKTSPISIEEANVITQILNLKTTATKALLILKKFIKIIPNMEKAVLGFEARLGALSNHNVNIEKLPFEGSYGLTSMEYYDGFVFSFSDGETIIASGGRYDALTAVLGSGKEIPAVGGVIRPDALIKGFQ
jgi:ATP phosphoribosyltransferase regulatory subunit